jgi:phthalate 4,5-cis-dihydrodiol dehydrogenase
MADITPLRLGVAGLGRAFSVMLPTFNRHPAVKLVAAADPRPEARKRFADEFSASAYDTVAELCTDPAVDAVYIATPHQFHGEHATLAARAGKHLLIEKPMALTLTDCKAIVDAARRSGVQVVVGHSHSFDSPVRHLRSLVESGAYGAVRMIAALNYTDYLYRPRRPEELDTSKGGGAIFNQAAHQIDIVRLITGAPVSGVRAMTGAWDSKRPTEGAYATLLTFANGTFASLVYSGYGRFDSDEFEGWIGEMGQSKAPYPAPARPHFKTRDDEIVFKNESNYGGSKFRPAGETAAHQHFGTLLVSCELADLRPVPNGVMVYKDGAAQLDAIAPPAVPRAEVVEELYQAIVNGKAPLHDAAWGMATVEVLLAMLQSARDGAEVRLKAVSP